ncbi:uncharacterized protein DUF3343 [Ruminiclostridium sufflavum DSM 19573]|uniref:Uncharacterized protein DUF3343 n=1 Tax=Ruminiclostridium sufflavum DSM 19573 TaxID=1121337 RepID=A0A318XG47_9FIRM|nr:DUF3343 domain-containing protein [Ruminiclostridium sufflavum]PYG84841.1 uncharacterized protein DUF3343 [Ruminiclostridium sufflavum DSM 19573]
MKCIAILDSGNLVYKLDSELEKRGYKFEVISIPCHIAKGGCGLCLRFPEEYLKIVIDGSIACNTPIREVYKIMPNITRNKYKRL